MIPNTFYELTSGLYALFMRKLNTYIVADWNTFYPVINYGEPDGTSVRSTNSKISIIVLGNHSFPDWPADFVTVN